MLGNFTEKLSKETVKTILYLLIISCFWCTSVYLLKPELLLEQHYIIFSIVLSLSITWTMPSISLTIILESVLLRNSNFMKPLELVRTEIYLYFTLLLKAGFILIGYYCNMNFICYLKMCFLVPLTIVLLLLLVKVGQHRMNKQKQVQ